MLRLQIEFLLRDLIFACKKLLDIGFFGVLCLLVIIVMCIDNRLQENRVISLIEFFEVKN